jgi:cytochrome c-type biogenesis protein CcmH/NrfG
MTFARPSLFTLVAVVATFAAALLAFRAFNDPDLALEPRSSGGDGSPRPARTTDERIAGLRAQIEADPAKAGTYVLLSDAYLAKVRETEDPSFYAGAERALAEARRRQPRSTGVALGTASMAMSKHDFRAGLAWAERAHRQAPSLVRPLGVIADAQIELGRYGAAERTLQRLVDIKPGIASYSRISYFRELHGDLAGAAAAMRLAVAAGGSRPQDVSDVEALLGHLELARGNTAEGERLFRSVLYSQPGHLKARDGLADVDLAGGRAGAALARWRGLSAAVPSPHYATDVAELAAATGRPAESRRAVARVFALDRGLAAAGVHVATESAVFEADWGSPPRALALARQGYAEAPSVGRADALGWALTRNGRPAEGLRHAREAMRLGTREPMFLYHGAIAARNAGHSGLARTWLVRLLDRYPAFSPLHHPRAERILRSLR